MGDQQFRRSMYAVAGVALMGATGLALYFLITKKKKTPPTPPSNPSSVTSATSATNTVALSFKASDRGQGKCKTCNLDNYFGESSTLKVQVAEPSGSAPGHGSFKMQPGQTSQLSGSSGDSAENANYYSSADKPDKSVAPKSSNVIALNMNNPNTAPKKNKAPGFNMHATTSEVQPKLPRKGQSESMSEFSTNFIPPNKPIANPGFTPSSRVKTGIELPSRM